MFQPRDFKSRMKAAEFPHPHQYFISWNRSNIATVPPTGTTKQKTHHKLRPKSSPSKTLDWRKLWAFQGCWHHASRQGCLHSCTTAEASRHPLQTLPRQAGRQQGAAGMQTKHQQNRKESSARLRKVPTRRSREEGTAAALWACVSGKRMQDMTAWAKSNRLVFPLEPTPSCHCVAVAPLKELSCTPSEGSGSPNHTPANNPQKCRPPSLSVGMWLCHEGGNTGCLGEHQQLQPMRDSDSGMELGGPRSQSLWDMDGMIWTHRTNKTVKGFETEWNRS